MRLLVYEHVSGGGFAGKPISTSVLSEGYAMLRAATSGFRSAGHRVTVMLDSRIAAFSPLLEADCTVPIRSSGDVESVLEKTAESVDAALVIAPESNGVLQSLVETVSGTRAASLNCKPNAIGEAADKAALYECAKALGISTPETIMFNARADAEEMKLARGRFSFPLVVKPVVGEGSGGVSLVRNEEQLAAGVEKASCEMSSECCLVQEFVEGVAASVTLFSTGDEALPVSLNWQNVALGTPEYGSSYEGGIVPIESPLRAEAFAAAKKVVESFRGLVGYVGVDVVLAEEKVVVLEVNPRLTTSVVGLNSVANFNLSQALLDAVLEGELPTDIENSGCAFFSKVAVHSQTPVSLRGVSGLSEVVSPPFPLGHNGLAHALLRGCGGTLKEALSRFREARKRLIRVCQGGG